MPLSPPAISLLVGVRDNAVTNVSALIALLVIDVVIVVVGLATDGHGSCRSRQGPSHCAHRQTGGYPGGGTAPARAIVVIPVPGDIHVPVDTGGPRVGSAVISRL